jgi:hypothetical protein
MRTAFWNKRQPLKNGECLRGKKKKKGGGKGVG